VRRLAWIATCLFVLSVPAAAHAAFPGQNGRIAFVNGPTLQSTTTDIYSAEPDGNALARLTEDGVSDNPAFSPDGSQLAYTSGTKVYIADQYANDPQLVLDVGVGAYGLDWSPDGTRLVASFPNCADWDCEPDIYVFGIDGSGLTNLTDSFNPEVHPAWAPDDSKIAFEASAIGGQSDIYTINTDGSGVQNITDDPDMTGSAIEPDWSPDASRIAFQSHGECCTLAWTANPDGTDRVSVPGAGAELAWSPDGNQFAFTSGNFVRVTEPQTGPHGLVGFGYAPDWQVRQPDPVPPPGGTGFPRPKGATPVFAALVPAYDRCTNPTLQHGPPLAYPSCVPDRSVFRVTVGTPDSNNGLPAEATGLVRLDAVPGDPATAADEADVWIGLNQTDVRYNFSQSGFPDYTGELLLVLPLRAGDLFNAGGEPDGSGTMVDFSLYVEVPCTPTAGPAGATCAVSTTVDAVVPGFVRERERAVWQLGQLSLQYEGLDGDPNRLADNMTFLRSGLFVP
jgi:hypothetical protein